MVSDTELRTRLLSDLGIEGDGSRWETPELLQWHQRRVLNKEGLDLAALVTSVEELVTNYGTLTSGVPALQEDVDALNISVAAFADDIDGTGRLAAANAIVVSVREYGAVGDGVTDDTLAIQLCFDECVAAGKTAYVPVSANNYICTDQLYMATNGRYRVDGILEKNFISGTGETGAFISSVDVSIPIEDVFLYGTGGFTITDSTMEGNIVFIAGDRVRIQDLRVYGFSGSRAWNFAGDDILCVNLSCYGGGASGSNGGFRFYAGTGFRAYGCYGESGDDLFQFVAAGNATSVFWNEDTVDCWFIGCHGQSFNGRICIIGLGTTDLAGDMSDGMSSSIIHSGFIACTGKAGLLGGMNCNNQNSTGVVRDCSFVDCSVDMIDNVAPQFGPGDIYVNGDNATGGIFNTRFIRCSVRNSLGCSAALLGMNSYDTLYEDCTFERSDIDDTEDITSFKGVRTRVKGGTFDCKGVGTSGVRFRNNGGVVAGPTEPICEDVVVKNIPDAGFGVEFNTATYPVLRRSRFLEATGATTAQAFRATANCSDLTIVENRWFDLTSATKYTDGSTGTLIDSNNR
jgi:hypothetical protein